MKKKNSKNKKTIRRITFLAGILVVGAIVGLTIKFGQAWVEPPSAATPPGGDIAAPINTGATTQTKHGGDICVDTNSDNVNEACLSTGAGGVPQGTIAIWSGSLGTIPSGWTLCNGRNGTPDLRNRFAYGVSSAENPGATGGSESASVSLGGRTDIRYGSGGPWAVNSVSVYAMPPYFKVAYIMKMGTGWVNMDLVGDNHSQSDCTSAGGTVVMDGSAAFCKFSQGSCSSGWTQYNSWSATSTKTCNGTFDTSHSCNSVSGDRTTCTTSNHGWGNVAPSSESCTVDNNQYASGSSCGYYCTYRNTGYYDAGCDCYKQNQGDLYSGDCSTCGGSLVGQTVCVDWTTANNLWAIQGIADCYANCDCQVPYAYCAKTTSSCFSNISQIGCF